ncbi:MAG: radical SAM protein, partial [Solirubrobacterales bacterium]
GQDFAVRPGLVELTHRLKAVGKHITIETAGTLFVPDLACDLMSISPKLRNATSPAIHQIGHCDPEILARLIAAYPYQLKFVIDSPEDIAEVREVLGRLGSVDPSRVLLMPQARTRDELLAKSPMVADLCQKTGFRFCDRLHIFLWSDERGR